VVATDQQLDQLRAARGNIDGRIRALPRAGLRSMQLVRDAQVANDLYVLVLNKVQELKIVKSGTIGSIRILDEAMVDTSQPIWPRKGILAALGLVFGLALGVAAAAVRRGFQRGLIDPEAIEVDTGLPVYATVPLSTQEKGGVLALTTPDDRAVESLRSLRTSLQFSLAEAKNCVVAVSGPRPGVGKSFVAMNLAHVLAASGRRTLLVDGDIRRGELHTRMGVSARPGLSDAILDAAQIEGAVRTTREPNLLFVPRGQVPPNPSELLLSDRFGDLLERLTARAEVVIIDLPPVLAVTDAAIVGRRAGVNLFVLRAGLHPLPEVQLALKRLQQGGAAVRAFVLNGLEPRAQAYTFGRYGYALQYSYPEKKK
jgi:tyrosine-protein kinase Etk/Wzc